MELAKLMSLKEDGCILLYALMFFVVFLVHLAILNYLALFLNKIFLAIFSLAVYSASKKHRLNYEEVYGLDSSDTDSNCCFPMETPSSSSSKEAQVNDYIIAKFSGKKKLSLLCWFGFKSN